MSTPPKSPNGDLPPTGGQKLLGRPGEFLESEQQEISEQPEIITIQDARVAGMCVHGLRQWFERHGLDFRAFLDHGIEADKLAATGDAGALRVIEITRKGAQ